MYLTSHVQTLSQVCEPFLNTGDPSLLSLNLHSRLKLRTWSPADDLLLLYCNLYFAVRKLHPTAQTEVWVVKRRCTRIHLQSIEHTHTPDVIFLMVDVILEAGHSQ